MTRTNEAACLEVEWQSQACMLSLWTSKSRSSTVESLTLRGGAYQPTVPRCWPECCHKQPEKKMAKVSNENLFETFFF